VRDQVRDKLDFSFEDMGEQQVKNIPRPIRTHRILLTSAAVEPIGVTGSVSPSARSLPQKSSIAVLPFANIGGDAEHEYFSERIAEDIITNLSRNRAFL
jgi:adenylate cyclase